MDSFEWLLYYTTVFDESHPQEKKEAVVCITQECLQHQQFVFYCLFALTILAGCFLWCWAMWPGIQEWRSQVFGAEDQA